MNISLKTDTSLSKRLALFEIRRQGSRTNATQEDFGHPWKRPSPLKAGCRARLLHMRLARRFIGAAARRMRNAQWATRCGRSGPVEAPISEAWEAKEAADCRIQYELQRVPQVIRTNKRKQQRCGGAERGPLFRVPAGGRGPGSERRHP